MAPSYRRLQQYAIAISIVSIFYNGAEGGVSIGLGSESSSRSLIFFGLQSAIEVISACIVLWRFKKVARPGEEKGQTLGEREIRIEKWASASISALIVALALATEVTAIVGLSLHEEPQSSNASLIISASALVLMVAIWLPKRYLARALDSSVMAGEATCSLSCLQKTIVLFIGSLVFRLWPKGWWVDSATSLVLGILFAWQGYKMIKWVRDPDFDGGCCKECHPPGDVEELGERYRDLCDCCVEKSECKDAGECKCGDTTSSESCCSPRGGGGSKCCTHLVVNAKPPNGKQVTSQCTSVTQSKSGCTKNDCCSTERSDTAGCSNAPAVGNSCCSKDSTNNNTPCVSRSPACCSS